MSLYSLIANSRNNIGTAASRRLRKINKLVPAIVYGDKIEPEKIQIPHKDLSKALEIEAFYSSIISLSIDGSEQPVILKALQRHPSKPKIIHADFQRASSNSVIKVNIPIHFLNKDTCVGVRQQGGILHYDLLEVEVSCAPADLPQFIEVDVSEIRLEQILHLSEIEAPKGLTFVALSHDNNLPVVSVNKIKGTTSSEDAE